MPKIFPEAILYKYYVKVKFPKHFFSKNKITIAFLLILAAALFIRFWQIEKIVGFGLDQGRDAWTVKDIVDGKLTLKGPQTGIGKFYLGPAYFYMLVPFFLIFRMDPTAANYLNILINIATFCALFIVARKIFGTFHAFISLIIYAASSHVIYTNRIPWNASLIPLVSILILYFLYKLISKKDYRLFIPLAFICGFFFHVHFTAIFAPPIVAASIFFIKEKKRALKWIAVSVPFFLVWLIPTAIDNFTTSNDNFYRFRQFLSDYLIGFHLRFLFYRLPDSLTQIAGLLYFKQLSFLRFVIPAVFLFTITFFEKDKNRRQFGTIMMLFFLVPLAMFTLFSGHVTDYYYLINLPVSVYLISYLTEKLFKIRSLPITVILICLLIFYSLANIKNQIKNPEESYDSLEKQKGLVKKRIKINHTIEYKEGHIDSYLWAIWYNKK